jgi:hypothetical protein
VEFTHPDLDAEAAAPIPTPDAGPRRGSKALLGPGLATSNGDVLAWSASPGPLEKVEHRANRRHEFGTAHRGTPGLLLAGEGLPTPNPRLETKHDARVRPAQRESTNFAWSLMQVPEATVHVPMRAKPSVAQVRAPPFSFLGEPSAQATHRAGVAPSPERRTLRRAPFGTEADVKDAFMHFG